MTIFFEVEGLVQMCFETPPIVEGESYGAAVWQIPELYGQLNSPQLEKIASLDAHSRKISWWASSTGLSIL